MYRLSVTLVKFALNQPDKRIGSTAALSPFRPLSEEKEKESIGGLAVYATRIARNSREEGVLLYVVDKIFFSNNCKNSRAPSLACFHC